MDVYISAQKPLARNVGLIKRYGDIPGLSKPSRSGQRYTAKFDVSPCRLVIQLGAKHRVVSLGANTYDSASSCEACSSTCDRYLLFSPGRPLCYGVGEFRP